MPSLHAAFSLFVVVFWFPRWTTRRLKVLALAYPATMGVALVYVAEHWVVDVLAGWLVVGAAFGIWHLVDARRSRRDPPSSDTTEPEEIPHAPIA